MYDCRDVWVNGSAKREIVRRASWSFLGRLFHVAVFLFEGNFLSSLHLGRGDTLLLVGTDRGKERGSSSEDSWSKPMSFLLLIIHLF